MMVSTTKHAGLRRRMFTLVEVMVASGVLAFAAAGIYGTITIGKRMLYQARFHAEAEAIAMDQVWFAANSNSYERLSGWTTTTAAVATTSPLFPRGGTVRVSTLAYGDHVTVTARVDWAGDGLAAAGSAFEALSVDRYPHRR